MVRDNNDNTSSSTSYTALAMDGMHDKRILCEQRREQRHQGSKKEKIGDQKWQKKMDCTNVQYAEMSSL